MKFIFKVALTTWVVTIDGKDKDQVTPQRSASRQLSENLKPGGRIELTFTDSILVDHTSPRLWTVGHSTRPADEFNQILLAHNIRELVDVRSFPGSRRYPHFNRAELALNLKSAGILYSHLPELGGRRRPSPDSKNTAWQNASFRAYADHLESAEFKTGIAALLTLARKRPTAVMCAEALWWRCHRSLIADFLKANGVEVIHILSGEKTESHPYTSAARIVEGRLSYEGLLGG